MTLFRWWLEGTSHYITVWLGSYFQKQLSMHFVCGYPRSGTTWFSEMLADYLNIPRPSHYVLPLGFSCVVHTHSMASSPINNCFYVYRDGRDSIVSGYFKLIRDSQSVERGHFFKQRYSELFTSDFDPDDIGNNLAKYITIYFRQGMHWGKHIASWVKKSQRSDSQIVFVQYEKLLDNPEDFFCDVLAQKYDKVDKSIAKEIVHRHSFESQKRRPEEQNRTYLRKGIINDWQNYFTQECAQTFHEQAGQELIMLGYENDSSWIYNCPKKI